MGSVDITNVLDTLIITIPAIIAAIYAARVHSQVKTPSGKAIGAQVEDALHTALSNNYHLQSIGTRVGVETTTKASGEAGQVEGLTDETPNGAR
jgi:hypothetical protein